MPVKTYFAARLVPLKSDWVVSVKDHHDLAAGKVGRIPELEVRRFRIKCGADDDCRGVLGYITESPNGKTYASVNEFFDARRSGAPRDAGKVTCLVTHPNGYRQDENGAYRTIETRRTSRALDTPYRIGRRPIPDKQMQSAASMNIGGYGIVGQSPVLPTIIYCPECGRPQDVLPPSR